MPRRPSGSVLHALGSPSRVQQQAQKSTETRLPFATTSSSSAPTLGPPTPPATPQQKVVHTLVNRLKNKLPCHSGHSLDRVETASSTLQTIETLVELSRESSDMIVWALTELMDRLAKQADSITGHLSIEILQSQLFILKVLSIVMASRWSLNSASALSEALANGDGNSHPPSIYSMESLWQEPAPFDDACVKYILSVMVHFMRQTSVSDAPLTLQTRSTDLSFRDFEEDLVVTPPPSEHQPAVNTLRTQPSMSSVGTERVNLRAYIPIAATNTNYEKTHMSLVQSSMSVNNLIARYVGRVVFHISASNWSVVHDRLSGKISHLAAHPESQADTVDLQLMAHSLMDRHRLVILLHQLSSLLVNMRRESQLAVATYLRSAVWNWIDLFPHEFNEAIRMRGKMEGAPERVFDLLNSNIPPGQEKIYWPTLSILLCCTTEKIRGELVDVAPASMGRRELKFGDNIMKNISSGSRLVDVALTCAIDICRVAAFVDPDLGEITLPEIAADMAHEIKGALSYTSNTKRHFWEQHDDIDVAMYSESLVALYRFLSLDDSIPLYQICMEPERSEAVKTCAIRATLTLVEDELRFKWQRKFPDLGMTIGPRCRAILRVIGVRRMDIDQNKVKRIASRPKAKYISAEPLSDREILLLGIQTLWRRDPSIFMIGLHSMEDHMDWMNCAVKLWEAPFDIAIKMSTAATMQKVSSETFMTPPVDDQSRMMIGVVKSSLPVTVLNIVGNLLTTRIDIETQRLWIDVAQQVLGTYAMDTDVPHIKEIQLDPSRLAAFMLAEVSFLVALTSSDNGISELAAKGLQLISHAERFPDSPVNPYISDEDKSKRNPIYEQLGSITIAGRLNHHKRVRRLIRMLTFSAGIQVVVWQECFNRWRALDDKINAMVAAGTSSQEQQEGWPQWQNLTLYLAALSGVCYGEGVQAFALDKIVPRERVPDKLRVIENPSANIDLFLEILIGHLVTSENTIRDVVREALGSELGPRLYTRLLDVLKTQVNALDGKDNDAVVSMMDQVVSTAKLMAENTQVALEEVVNVDIGPVMIAMARRIARCYGASAQRLRVKYCNLCESIGCRSDNISLRIDGTTRHEILEFILHWMAPPKKAEKDSVADSELGMSCLRATVNLLNRLELRSNSQGDDVNTVPRLFTKYAGALLGSIGTCQAELTAPESPDVGLTSLKTKPSPKVAELDDLVILGLTHLVSANSESGFKQCLRLAYDQDNRKRTIFARVFARVIGQGTVFNAKDKSVLKARFQGLYELVRGPDLILPIIVCDICPSGDVDIIISVLLNVFNTRASLLCVIKRMIEREVSQTVSEVNLFRTNSTFIRFLSAFGRLHGYNYLRSLVQPLVHTMSAMPPGTSYELNPDKAIGQDLAANQRSLEYVASTFINLMSSSLPALPGMFRDIGAHIAKVVSDVWPESKYAAMGAFIFLRFISPAIVSPGVVDIEVPKNENASIRHGLLAIAKIIQNLANNIFFGKEPHMTPLNKFLESNITNVTRFLSELHKYGGVPDDINDNWTGTTSDETDVIVLHRFFQKHADRIGKELLSQSSGIDVGGSTVTGKQIWDNFCALLVDLGPPLEVPRLSSSETSCHREYLEFMSKYDNRSTTPVEHIFMETDIKEENTAVFVLRLSVIDVEGLDIELLMYHIFKILTSETYSSRSFDLILDCTSFSSNSEIPLQWLKYCAELIPSDIRLRFKVARILNPNTLMQKFMRRLYNISAGIPFCGDIKIYTSVLQLMEDVRTAALPPLKYPVSLEQEAHENFNDVTMRTVARVPVVLRVGSTHIRVTSIKSLPISPGLSCQSTELIPLTDVSDIYNVSTGHDQHEFIIRRRQGVTVYFSSQSRELIVKTIRSTKGRLKEAQAPLEERFSRFSNVPASLLHIGFLSIDLDDEELRGAGYELLAAVCDYLKYDKSPLVAPSAGFIPGDPTTFVAQLSEKLAEFAPQLTLDFIHEISAAMSGPGMDSMNKSSIAHRISCLFYMSPWIQNLSHFANATHVLYERSGARLRDCIRTLADLSVSSPEIMSTIQKEIWSEVSKLDAATIDIVLDELIRAATDGEVGTPRCESISHIIATLSSMNVRARIYSKLRKALSKVPSTFTNTLVEHPNWSEISTLIRLTHLVGSQSTQPGQSYTFVPEVVHLMSLVAGEGPTLVRKSAYGTVINLLQALYIPRPEDGDSEIKQLINDFTHPENLKLFGLQRETPTSEYIDLPEDEKNPLDTQERLVQLLVRVLDVSAGSQGLLNVWRARWMSLVTSTAFQQSPAVQARSFVVLATLASRQVDDDFLYQILVAFRTALSKANETNTVVIVSMLRCLCRIVPAIAETSRYVCCLFWLAVAVLQVSHVDLYAEATWLLGVTLEYMEQHDLFKNNSVETVLLEAREAIDEVMSQLDDILRISFARSFSYSLASIIFKGMRHTSLKVSAQSILRTLLRITSRAYPASSSIDQRFSPTPEALPYFIALLPVSATRKAYKKLLGDSNFEDPSLQAIPDSAEANESTPRINAAVLGIEDSQQALLAASFIGTILSTAQGNDAETEILYGLLCSLALSYPETVTMIYDSLQDRIKEAFANSSNSNILRSVSSIFKMTLQDPSKFTLIPHESNATLSSFDEASVGPSRSHLEALDRLDMQGLANSFQFLPPNRGHATRMINWIPGIVTHMINSG